MTSMNNEQNNTHEQEILENNKILYCMHKKPMTETCMCWGLDVPNVWLNEIDDLSKKLEGMNSLVYPVHKVRIQADQVKNKFGILHYYFSVMIDPPALINAYENTVELAMRLIRKINFKLKMVTDKEAYDETIKDNIPADKVDEEKKRYEHCSNVEIIDQPDGTAIKKSVFHHCKQVHYEPTKHKWMYALFKRRWTIKNFLRNLLKWKPSYRQVCIAKVMDSYAFNAIRDCEEKCMHICEQCGHYIGDKWSPTCMTTGWISYLCEECAIKDGGIYVKNGESWCAGKKVEKEDESNEDKN